MALFELLIYGLFNGTIFLLFLRLFFGVISSFLVPTLHEWIEEERADWHHLYEQHRSLVREQSAREAALVAQRESLKLFEEELKLWQKRMQKRQEEEIADVNRRATILQARRVEQATWVAAEENRKVVGSQVMKRVRLEVEHLTAGKKGQAILSRTLSTLAKRGSCIS